METPLVSIITPTFNNQEVIYETLDCIKRQTYQNWEFILVDDGSTDNTLNIIRKYLEVDNRYKLFQRMLGPKGANKCRNIGIKKSNGEYLIFLDSDDLFSNRTIESRVAYLEKHKDLDFAIFPCLRFKNIPYDQFVLLSSYHGIDVIPLFLNRDIPWGSLSPIYRKRKIIENNLYWNEKVTVYQDIEFHLKTVCRNLKFYMPKVEPDCFWREHGIKNTNYKTSFIKRFESNKFLVKSFVNELSQKKLLKSKYKRIIVRNYLVKQINESIDLDLVSNTKLLPRFFREESLISYFSFVILSMFFSINQYKIKHFLLKNYTRIWLRLFGINKLIYFLTPVNSEKT